MTTLFLDWCDIFSTVSVSPDIVCMGFIVLVILCVNTIFSIFKRIFMGKEW